VYIIITQLSQSGKVRMIHCWDWSYTSRSTLVTLPMLCSRHSHTPFDRLIHTFLRPLIVTGM